MITANDIPSIRAACDTGLDLTAAVAERKFWQVDRLREAAAALPVMVQHCEGLLGTTQLLVGALLASGHDFNHDDSCWTCATLRRFYGSPQRGPSEPR